MSHSQTQVTNMDIEEQPFEAKTTKHTSPKKRRCLIIIGVILFIIFLLFLVGLILALTVFKVHKVEAELVAVKIEGVAPTITFPVIQIRLNITLNLQISIKNRNYASFRRDEGTSYLFYEGVQVGEAVISPGLIKARGSSLVDYILKLQADEVVGEMDKLIRDVVDGELVLVAKSRIPGRVNFMGIFKRNAVAFSDCVLGVDVMGMKVTRQECTQRTQL